MEKLAPSIKKGYKQTDVGVIPEDWKLISYKDAFNFLSTATYSRSDLSNNQAVLYVHYGDIHTKLNDFLDLNTFDLPSIDIKKAKKYSRLVNGDLLIADASEDYEGICKSVEVKNVNTKEAISGLHTFLLRDKKKVFANGFRGYLRSIRIVKSQLEKLATGLKVYGVSKSNLKLVLIPLPPLSEQQAIAEALSEMDALITSLDQLIAKKRNIKQVMMQLLLTGKKRLPNFSGDWETKTLGAVIKLKSGFAFSSTFFSDKGAIVLTPGNFRLIGGLYFNERNTKRFCGDYNSQMRFKNGDLLVVMTDLTPDCNLLGKPAFVDTNDIILHNQRIGKIELLRKDLDKQFLYYFFLSTQYLTKIKETAVGSTVRHTSNKSIYDVSIAFPTIEEQNAIVQILSDMDVEIEALEIKRNKYNAVNQGMMQELLTGRIRLL